MPDDPSNFTRRQGQIKLREEMGGEPASAGSAGRALIGRERKDYPTRDVEGTKQRQQQEMESIQNAVKRPGTGGPDPTNHNRIGREIVNTRLGPFHGGPLPTHTGRSTAAPDVALPHMAHGVQRAGNVKMATPPMGHAPDRAPPKLGAYPAPASGAHGYGHTAREGHLRNSGDSRAHRIGRK